MFLYLPHPCAAGLRSLGYQHHLDVPLPRLGPFVLGGRRCSISSSASGMRRGSEKELTTGAPTLSKKKKRRKIEDERGEEKLLRQDKVGAGPRQGEARAGFGLEWVTKVRPYLLYLF